MAPGFKIEIPFCFQKNIAPQIFKLYNVYVNKEKLIAIGEYILKGMTEKEACTLVDVAYDIFLQFKERDEFIFKFIEKKHVEFKYNHVNAIQSKKSDKNSMYLLEKLRPDEFGSRSKNSPSPTINIINAIIKDIQNDQTTIVAHTRTSREENKEDTGKFIVGAALLN